jgi:hypothetical protein
MAILNATDFPQVQKYFRQVDQRTAPNGLGYSVTMNAIGDPSSTPGILARFGEGFPDCLRVGQTSAKPIDFIVRKVTHQLGMDGYKNALDVVDFYTAFGSSGVY